MDRLDRMARMARMTARPPREAGAENFSMVLGVSFCEISL